MRKTIIALFMTVIALAALSGCKSGCGCHGDPFGEQIEMSAQDKA